MPLDEFGHKENDDITGSNVTIQSTDDIRKEVDQGNLVGAIFIDLSKAFDTISHGALLNKLQANGV